MKSPFQYDPQNIQSTADLKHRLDVFEYGLKCEIKERMDELRKDLERITALPHHQELVKKWDELEAKNESH